MAIHVMDASRGIDLVDDPDMSVGVIDHGAGTDAARLQRRGIKPDGLP